MFLRLNKGFQMLLNPKVTISFTPNLIYTKRWMQSTMFAEMAPGLSVICIDISSLHTFKWIEDAKSLFQV